MNTEVFSVLEFMKNPLFFHVLYIPPAFKIGYTLATLCFYDFSFIIIWECLQNEAFVGMLMWL